MSSKRFLYALFVGFATMAALIIPLNLYIDVYALFRPAAGRSISIYGEERIAKYLHSFRYIPENFDGVLLGSSGSDNLDTRAFRGYRIYNASINGGNIEDVRPISENVLRGDKLKLVLICIHRYITRDHLQKTDLMNPREYWSALGSPQLLTTYISRTMMQMRLTQELYDSWGSFHFGDETDGKNAEGIIKNAVISIRNGSKELENYEIDPVAFQELNGILVKARRAGRRLVIYYPPVPTPILELRAVELARYRSTIQTILQPSDLVVDFNAPTYVGFRSDLRNFIDYSHLSKRGAAFVVAELSSAVAASDFVLETKTRRF